MVSASQKASKSSSVCPQYQSQLDESEGSLSPLETDNEDDVPSDPRIRSSHFSCNDALRDAAQKQPPAPQSSGSSVNEVPVLDVLFDADFVSEDQRRRLQHHVDRILIEQLHPPGDGSRLLSDAVPYVAQGVSDIVDDSFNRCFQPESPKKWNWGYLKAVYPWGVLIRYAILFPLRLSLLCVSSLLLAIAIVSLRTFMKGEHNRDRRVRKESWLMTTYAQSLMLSWGAVVSYHGVRPRYKANQVYVANHSSLIDYVLLLGVHPFSVVGQLHGGLVGFFQTKVLNNLGCLWFERKDAGDRRVVRAKIQEHVRKKNVAPLVLFPEGTCVANRHTVMFKKGAFELEGCEVYPVALKYSPDWAVAFWDSRKQSFLRYALGLMSSWALVCDVWFLPPMRRRKNESPVEFADRAKEAISKKAGLLSVPWDGYMKHVRPSERYKKARQMAAARELLSRAELASKSGSAADILSSPRVSLDNLRRRKLANSVPPLDIGDDAVGHDR